MAGIDVHGGVGLPIASRLSQALVAFTIEFDNEFERRMVELGLAGFRTSLVMWMSVMRHVPEGGARRAEVAAAAGLPADSIGFAIAGLERWGYLRTFGGRAGSGTIAPTPTGSIARGVWGSLLTDVDARWCERLGEQRIADLASALAVVVEDVGRELPDHFPAFGVPAVTSAQPGDRIFAPLARILLALTLDHDRRSPVPLGLTQNVLRAVPEDTAIRVRDLPAACGIARETVGASLAESHARELIVIDAEPPGRGKIARLTSQGAAARTQSISLLQQIEAEWTATLGGAAVELRAQLEHLLDSRAGKSSLLGRGLQPHLEGWRAKSPYKSQTARMIEDPSEALPHHPMLVRQGGWPDGA